MNKQNLCFSAAMSSTKQGIAVTRNGWNSKGMCVFLNRGVVDTRSLHDAYKKPIPCENLGQINGVSLSLFNPASPGTQTEMPHYCMRNPDGNITIGWVPSQVDMLAEDWCEVTVSPQLNGSSAMADQANRAWRNEYFMGFDPVCENPGKFGEAIVTVFKKSWVDGNPFMKYLTEKRITEELVNVLKRN